MGDNMFIFMDILVAGCGVYVLYAYYVMRMKGEVKEKLLLSEGTKISKCKDKDAYIRFMLPRLLFFGIVTTIGGVIGILNSYSNFLGMGYLAVLAVFLAAVIWFGISVRKAVKTFW